MNAPRIAIFDDWWPLQIGDEVKEPEIDAPTNWARFMEAPKLGQFGDGTYYVDDQRAVDEIHRLMKFKTCPICRTVMELICGEYDLDDLYICLSCGYWAGRGYRDWGSHFMQSTHPPRAVISRYNPIQPVDLEINDYLVTHLRRRPRDMTKISPERGEEFVIALLGDCLGCEVRHIGRRGHKDNGVDGYILKGDAIRSIIQVKWRQDLNQAEGIQVVREVAGTLVARGIPSGILVSNRAYFTKPAIDEADTVSTRHLSGLGKIELSLYDYHTIIDMLEISNTKLTASMTISDWFRIPNSICVFDGASAISASAVKRLMSGRPFTIRQHFEGTCLEHLGDAEVIDLADRARNDCQAMDALLRHDLVPLVCRYLLGSIYPWWNRYFTDYDDLCQEVRLRISRRLSHHSKFSKAADFVGWVVKLARRVCLKGLERHRVEYERQGKITEATKVGVDDFRMAFIIHFGSINDDLVDQVFNSSLNPVSRTHRRGSAFYEELRQRFLQTEARRRALYRHRIRH